MMEQSESAIIDACQRQGRQYEDPHFPASDSSLDGAAASGEVCWLRPKEVYGASARLFAFGDSGSTALARGIAELGDCWLLGALSTLAAHPALVRRLFVSTRGSKVGLYTLQFWRFDEWVQIMIDDRIPCDEAGRPLFAGGSAQPSASSAPTAETSAFSWAAIQPSAAEPAEFWVPLVEKGFAKLRGSYAALQGGLLSEAMRDLTGGVPIHRELVPSFAEPMWSQPRQLTWDWLLEMAEEGAPVAFYRPGAAEAAGEDEPLTEGERGELLRGLPYPCLQTHAEDGKQLVCLGVPCGSAPPSMGMASASADSSCAPPSHSFWLRFEQLHEHFDLALAAADAAEEAEGPRAARRQRSFEWSQWMARESGEAAAAPAASSMRVRVEGGRMDLSMTLVQHPAALQPSSEPLPPAPIALVLLRGEPEAEAALREGGELEARLLLAHTLPTRTQREVILEKSPLEPGEYFLFAHRALPAHGLQSPEPLQHFSVDVMATAQSSGARLSVEPLAEGEQLGRAPALRVRGDEALSQLLSGGSQSAWPQPEDEEALHANLARMAAQPARRRAAAMVQAHARGTMQRRELGELAALRAEEDEAAAVSIQASIRGREGRAAAVRTRRVKTGAAGQLQAGARGAQGRAQARELRASRAAASARQAAEEQAELDQLQKLHGKFEQPAVAIQAALRGRRGRGRVLDLLAEGGAQAEEGEEEGKEEGAEEVSAEGGAEGGGAEAYVAESPEVLSRLRRIEELLANLTGAELGASATEEEEEEEEDGFCLEEAEEEARRLDGAATSIQAHSRRRRAVLGRQAAREAAREAERADAAAGLLQRSTRGMQGRRRAKDLRRLQAAEDFGLGAGRVEIPHLWPLGDQTNCTGLSERPCAQWTSGLHDSAEGELLFVPRHMARAALHAKLNGFPQHPTQLARPWLPEMGRPPPAKSVQEQLERANYQPVRSYRACVLELQRQQRAELSRLPLARPQRVATLVWSKDEALEALIQQRAGAAQRAPAPPSLAEPSAVEVQRAQYERQVRVLLDELARQRVSAEQVAKFEKLNGELESAMERVLQLELRATRNVTQGPTNAHGEPKSQVCVIS